MISVKAMPKHNDLTEIEKLFCEEYLSTGMDRAAAIKASGSEATTANSIRQQAHRILNRPHVKAYLDKRLADTILSTNQILAGISDRAENAELDRDRLKAYELLGKHLKLFTEKSEININVGELTDQQLEALARS